jgi:hypothetical protein
MEQFLGDDRIASGVQFYLDYLLVFAKKKVGQVVRIGHVLARFICVITNPLGEVLFNGKRIEYLECPSGGNIEITSDRSQDVLNALALINGSKLSGFLWGLVMLRWCDSKMEVS